MPPRFACRCLVFLLLAAAAGFLARPAEAAKRPFADIVDAAARRHGVDADLVHAVIAVESGYRASVQSPVGAQGLMQLMPRTQRHFGVSDAFDPHQNVDAGVAYLRRLTDEFGTVLALAAYNAGPGAVRRYNGIPPYEQTHAYLRAVLGRNWPATDEPAEEHDPAGDRAHAGSEADLAEGAPPVDPHPQDDHPAVDGAADRKPQVPDAVVDPDDRTWLPTMADPLVNRQGPQAGTLRQGTGGGPGVDTVDYSRAAQRGVNISLGTSSTSWPDGDGTVDDGAGDDFSSIENIVGTTFNDWLAGDSGHNQIQGRDGNDWIFGAGGADTLFGGCGADYLFGGPGDDVLFGGEGPDRIDGGPGSDTVTYAGAAAGVAVSLGDAGVGTEEDTLEGVEIVVGSNGDDTIRGDEAANLLAGMRGDDEITGGGGADTLWGGRGADTLHGGPGPGPNRLTGGPGVDRFVFDEKSGDAVITDFAGDRIDLTAFGFTPSAFEQHVTIEEERFVIDVDGAVIRVEVGVELGLADLSACPGGERSRSRSRTPYGSTRACSPRQPVGLREGDESYVNSVFDQYAMPQRIPVTPCGLYDQPNQHEHHGGQFHHGKITTGARVDRRPPPRSLPRPRPRPTLPPRHRPLDGTARPAGRGPGGP